MKVAYIFFNGKIKDNNFYKNFIEKNKGDIFCADGGANLCYKINLTPKEIWGDLDSISKEILNFYIKEKVEVKKFPANKDKTDSELILEYLSQRNYEKIYCIATLGGAIEHELTNINLLFKYENLIFLTEKEKIFKINEREEFCLKNLMNKKISFLIYSDKVEKISLKGFKYNLEKENFLRGDSRLVSNIIENKEASIFFERGKLLCVLKNNS